MYAYIHHKKRINKKTDNMVSKYTNCKFFGIINLQYVQLRGQ